MKQEDYFQIMDCASEEDITEMMQHRRFRQTPSDAEEITMKQTEQKTKKEIRMSRRGVAAGTAVAAVLLALNVGGGYLLLHGKDSQQTATEADCQVSSMIEETAEPAAPRYCRLMQEYYAQSGNGTCDFDFSDYGMDLNEVWENDAYRITVTAVTGCDWVLYYFYDVEPKQEQSYEQYWNEDDSAIVTLTVGAFGDSACFNGNMPGWENRTDNGVWHCVGMVSNTTGEPFFSGKEEKPELNFSVPGPDEESEINFAVVDPDFSAPEYPLEDQVPSSVFSTLSEKAYINAAGVSYPDPQALIDSNLPVRSAATPFGVFCYSDMFAAADYPNESCQYLFCLTACDYFRNMPFEAFGSFIVTYTDGSPEARTDFSELSNYGLHMLNHKGRSYVNLLFRTPMNLSQADQLAYIMEPAEQNESAEQSAGEQTDAPAYVGLMQDYYCALAGMQADSENNAVRCDYDFTGLGKDIDYTFEWDDYRLTYRAVVGCDWVLYYFFDAEPKQGQDYEQFLEDFPDVERVDVSLIRNGAVNTDCDRFESRVIRMDHPELDNGVWHCVGIICNVTGKPFFCGENAGTQICITERPDNGREAMLAPPAEPFDFATKAFPLCESETPVIRQKPFASSFNPPSQEEIDAQLNAHPMTQCARTPFGRFYISEAYQVAPEYRDMVHWFGHWAGSSLNMEGIAPAVLDAVHCGECQGSGNGNAFLIVLYDRPVEAEEAE